ncbi:pseudouridine synthase [Ruminococcus sp.]|uniref:pseudouridine synthase n=1 Tax=Ruminococcus sp. TaxID=41978 RepID=UPI002D1729B8|nr:pseudouridine synthase [Ruminococcus sp.]HNZ99464.1 pseudouridine synthase [Ruminococcus sp.]HOH86024.1 pseudouridine synthase [Ruminococcus sp.]
MASVRLDKFISERTEYTRSQIKELAAKGKITIDGAPVKRCDVKIDPDTVNAEVCGRAVGNSRFRYILLNKPQGYVCSTDDKDGETVLKLIPEEMRTKGMFPAGRLDKDSMGALLLTDDGELAHRMLSPRRHIPKVYIVKLARPFENNYVNKFSEGLTLADGETCLPARVKKAENSDNLAFVELCEGKYRQVKRMFASVGNHVEVLMRVSLGALVLPEKLAIGECMELLHKDVENLFKEADFELFCRRFSAVFSANFLINLD